MSKITIVIPVYNTPEHLLRTCLHSCLSQTLADIQVVAVDDASKDFSGKICDEIATTDSRLMVIHTENRGVSNARNVGIENADAPYIIFVDADDCIESDICEKCFEVMEHNTVNIMFFKPTGTKFEDDGSLELHDKNFIQNMQVEIISHTDRYKGFVYGSPWGKVFRKSFLNDNSLRFALGVKRTQDRLFMLYCLEAASQVLLYSCSGYTYVRNDESICNKYNKEIVSILNNARNHIEKFVEKYHKGDDKYERALHNLGLSFAFTEMQLFYLNRLGGQNVRKRALTLKKIFGQEPLKTDIERADLSKFVGKARIVYKLLSHRLFLLTVIAYDGMNVLVLLRNRIKR